MATIFKFGNDELETLCKEPSLQNLLAYFNARTTEWPHSVMHMELYTVDVFYDLRNSFKHADAFDLLGVAMKFPWETLPDNLFLLAIDLVSDLASASDTTEAPSQLTDNWERLASRIMSLNPTYLAWEQLRRQYRK